LKVVCTIPFWKVLEINFWRNNVSHFLSVFNYACKGIGIVPDKKRHFYFSSKALYLCILHPKNFSRNIKIIKRNCHKVTSEQSNGYSVPQPRRTMAQPSDQKNWPHEFYVKKSVCGER